MFPRYSQLLFHRNVYIAMINLLHEGSCGCNTKKKYTVQGIILIANQPYGVSRFFILSHIFFFLTIHFSARALHAFFMPTAIYFALEEFHFTNPKTNFYIQHNTHGFIFNWICKNRWIIDITNKTLLCFFRIRYTGNIATLYLFRL